MWIESVERPIRYQWPGGEIRLIPGKPVQVDEERGKKVLATCGSKVRMCLQEARDLTGKMVRFSSPVFGECTGRVVMEDGDIVIVEEHSVFHGMATIYRNWICGVE